MSDVLPLFSLAGETALVTGATRGIGAAIADALAAAGATVIGTATSAAGAEAIAARLAAAGHAGRGVVLDVDDHAAIAALEADISAREGAVTILVNNAGITRDGLLMRTKPEDWDAVIRTNLGSVFATCRTFIRGMVKARRGRIINISSIVGVMGNAGQTNYAAAKAGMMGFSRSLAREVASRGITVNVVAPGFIATDMTAALGEAERNALSSQIPLQRLGTPADVAAAVLYLASPAGGYVTGETLQVNGGLWMG
ncbi:MAG: 3-oxoacyl-ACP reductase FabG [Chromatiales bacterium]|jgi:3-oxoacyl-[acyl-carrier protein] reductase|nr:3-oxoacyl-ACP reductase FabG [Chromatiales bacterium]